MKKLLVTLAALGFIFSASAQKHFTKTGHIWFFSDAPLEDITAHNYQVTSVLNTETGGIAFKVTMTGFQFEKALMQQHFNEKYVESDKFPESTFDGKITNLSEIDFSKDGTYKAIVEGNMTIHGVMQLVKADGTIEVKGGKISAKSVFKLTVADYKIQIPGTKEQNIAKIIEITVEMAYEPKQ